MICLGPVKKTNTSIKIVDIPLASLHSSNVY